MNLRKKTLLLLMVTSCLSLLTYKSFCAKSKFIVNLKGLHQNDSAMIIVQKSSEIFYKQLTIGNGSNSNSLEFDLEPGKWAINIGTKGYTFPPAKAFDVPHKSAATITLTPMLNEDYTYSWQDDESYVGHATQSYRSEPEKIKIVDKSIKVPNDYSSIELRNKFGIILSDEGEKWTIEDSYRVFMMFSALPYTPYSEGTIIDLKTGKNVRGIFELTKDEQYRDLTIEVEAGIKKGTISQAALCYASPQIVTIDGIKGKFYSKRLYHAMVNFVTDFGTNGKKVDWIAKEKFGIKFMKSNQETEDLMNEDASNFQEFFSEEKIEILSMLEELPAGFQRQEGLKYLVRRINGQENPTHPQFAAIAWVGNENIEFMERAFKGSNLNSIRRLILHEKTHFLWEYTFDETLKKDWADVGGWFEDPTVPSGWSTSNTTAFVSPYGHDNNPNEDMAESVAYYLENPDKLKAVSMEKYEFIRDRIMHGTRYTAQIREDLTFMVYNLFPDYTFPGKVTSVDVTAKGEPKEDKEVTIKVSLHAEKGQNNVASGGYIRFVSILGTLHDMRLYPVKGSGGTELQGTTTFTKYEKSGYWTMASFRIWDVVGNQRFENTSTLGMKLFIENPLEDAKPPKWNNDLKMELVDGKFSGNFNVHPDKSGEQMKAIKVTYSYYDAIPLKRSLSRIIIANANNKDFETYSRDIQSSEPFNAKHKLENGLNSNKYFEMYLGVRDYLQPGYYSITYSAATDIGRNESQVFFVDELEDFHIDPDSKDKLFKDKRDSVYVETKYPDYLKPEIDINRIDIKAEPTNPKNPDGETRVDISILARDLSDYVGKESGVYRVSFVLRDPLGIEHGYQTGNSTMNHPESLVSAKPDNTSEWKSLDFNFLLPKGSAPGKWGISSATVLDRAGNRKRYSFVEYVRFDVIKSDIKLKEELTAKIMNKYVNADNVNNISVNIKCKPGDGLNYLYTIYSLSGGKVVKGSGKMNGNEITLEDIDTQGVLDGVIKLTVQLTDDKSQLVATKTIEYDKDTQRPKAYYTRTNIQDEGESNLDDKILEIVFEESEIGSTYDFSVEDVTAGLAHLKSTNTITFSNTIDNGVISLTDLDIFNGKDKVIMTKLKVTDRCQNIGEERFDYFLVQNGKLLPINKESDSDNDGIADIIDSKPTAANPDQQLPKMKLTAYPNPAKDKITIETEGLGTISVYNMKSQLILEKEVTSRSEIIDISKFYMGSYFIQYDNTRSTKSVRFIKK